MISKYYQCTDPEEKCTFSVTKEYIKVDSAGPGTQKCPGCDNELEQVGFLEGVSNGKPGLVYSGLAGLAALLLVVLFLSGSDTCPSTLQSHDESLNEISSSINALKTSQKQQRPSSPLSVDSLRKLSSEVSEFSKKVNDAVSTNNDVEVAELKTLYPKVSTKVGKSGLRRSSASDTSGSKVAEAKRLLSLLQELEEEVSLSAEQSNSDCGNHDEEFDALLDRISTEMRSARSLIRPRKQGVLDPALAEAFSGLQNRLKKTKEALDGYQPAPTTIVEQPQRLPFTAAEATFRIHAPQELGQTLLKPLIEEWKGTSATISQTDANIYLKLGDENILIQASPVQADLSISSESHSISQPALSRSNAEVIALDALTLLVHPSSLQDTFRIQNSSAQKLTSPTGDQFLKAKASSFGLSNIQGINGSSEEIALSNRSAVVLGVYHREANMRAKRLKVKASPSTAALKPSPFTIATEDYPFTWRIIAHTPASAKKEALQLVKFITSDKGQTIVDRSGYVDLRLKPMDTKVAPEILAALGEALGVDSIQSATRLSTNLRFDTGDAKLDIKALADLERLPRYVASNYPTHKVVILGFTDSTGGPNINVPLSKKRSHSVAAELRSSGVDSHSSGLGASLPVASNDFDSGKAKNRRAEVWVVKP